MWAAGPGLTDDLGEGGAGGGGNVDCWKAKRPLTAAPAGGFVATGGGGDN